jgi:hypothetical protein
MSRQQLRPWMTYVGIGLVGLVIGVAAGGGSAEKAKTVTKTKTTVSTIEPSAAELAQARKDIRGLRGQVADRRSALRDLERKISGARRAVKRSTIPGDGTFMVGTDIDPGTYRAAAREGCYWARLASLSGSDIAENDISDGPMLVEISSSDKAFKTSGCATFHKVS